MTKDDQISRLRTLFSGTSFRQLVPQIEATHHPLMLRTPDSNPWRVTTDEAEQVLHDYAPTLSVAISDSTMVVFREKKE